MSLKIAVIYLKQRGEAFALHRRASDGDRHRFNQKESPMAFARSNNDTLQTAERITVDRQTRNYRSMVSGSDPVDVYSFRLRRTSTISFVLRELRSNADLAFLDSAGNVIAQSRNSGKTSEVIAPIRDGLLRTFAPGEYFVRVNRVSGRTRYKLSATAIPVDVLPPGPTEFVERTKLDTARTIKVDRRTRRYRGEVDGNNTEDFYRFELRRFNFFSATLRNLDADADLSLIASDGSVLRISGNRGEASEVIAPQRSLRAGVYFLRVQRQRGSTDYDLTVTALPDTERGTGSNPGGGGSGSTASLVRDINAGSASSIPGSLVNFNGTLLFSADDGNSGRELWRSDGTSGNTSLVSNINSGSASSNPGDLTVAGGFVYFSADDGTNGTELWRTDGTTTSLVADINAGGASSNPSDFVEFNGFVYFAAEDSTNGRELWRTDGTSGGTQRVTDINSGAASSNPVDLVVSGNGIYFAADDGQSGRELWTSGGTAATTNRVSDINAGSANSNPSDLVVFNGDIYFAAENSQFGRELWQFSNGTTTVVTDLNPGAANSNPSELTVSNNQLFFSATTTAEGNELRVTDGTNSGTRLVRNLNAGSADANPADLVDGNGTLYFVASNGSGGRQVWQTTGSSASTTQVTTGTLNTFNPAELTVVGSQLFFSANTSAQGRELWQADITP